MKSWGTFERAHPTPHFFGGPIFGGISENIFGRFEQLIFLDQVKRHCDLKTKRSIADEAYLWRSPVLCNIAINVKWFIWTSSPVIFWWVKKSLACLILAPTNVLTWYVKVTSAGVCKLGDFGCSVSLTANGKGPEIELAGTPGYQVDKNFRLNNVVNNWFFVPRLQSC